jgi:kynureninase
MRFGITPLFTSLEDITQAVDILANILTEKTWQNPEFQSKALVT